LTVRFHWLAVRPNLQRHGIGRYLLTWAERQAFQWGAIWAEAETLVEWASAMRFYEACGYERRE
jgi:GNAT superfamily N-acetyltransferase